MSTDDLTRRAETYIAYGGRGGGALVRDLLTAVKELDESVAQWKGLWKGTVETADQWAVERDVANAAIARVEALADKWAAEIDGAARAAAKELHRALVGDDDE